VEPSAASAAFVQARDAIRAVIAHDAADPTLEAVALPRLYEHGEPVEHALVLFHGFTNCPQQCDELARHFHALGCNVYVPRIPGHGRKDRLTRELARMTTADVQAAARAAYRLTAGLGRRVSGSGISLGASLVLWLAQTEPIDVAIPVAPFLMPLGIPRVLGTLVMRLLDVLPDMYWWWDPRVKEQCRPRYAYPGFPTHALAECAFLCRALFEAGRRSAPLARRCVLVTNHGESAVNNGVARSLLALWQRGAGTCRELVLYGLGPPRHDIFDPSTYPDARTKVYPELEALVFDGSRAGGPVKA
jgi:alpha-beta hydrolase superfamily lysophospholipase